MRMLFLFRRREAECAHALTEGVIFAVRIGQKICAFHVNFSALVEELDVETALNGAVLEAGGADFSKVFKTTCFLADMGDFAAFNEVYARYFISKPARSCVEVARLPKDVLVEIECIAAE